MPTQLPETPTPLSRGKRIRLVIKVIELRLRFIALMAATALTFAYWDTLWNRYDKWARPASGLVAAGKVSGLEFFCPMHPNVVREEPGSCPICGMPLSRRKAGELSPLGPGVTARVSLGPDRVRQAGIATAEVVYSPLANTLTAVGVVAYDERRLAHIASKVRGMARVERLAVNVTGQAVAAGDVLADLYSPELYQAIQELLLARRSAQNAPRMQTALGRSALGDPEELTRLAAEKLTLWGLTRPQIDEILRKGKADPKVSILAPLGGHVVRKSVVEGQYVQEGQSMFEIADLSTVWVVARVHEDQIGQVRVGQKAEATVEAFPGRAFPGTVAFIQPHLDAATRTVEVRYDLANPDQRLRPGMFAEVTLSVPVAETSPFRARFASMAHNHQENCPVTLARLGSMGEPVPVEVRGRKVLTCCAACGPKLRATPATYLARLDPPPRDKVLSVPESAVVDTGQRQVVYVESEPGVFEGRKVTLGPLAGNRFPVLDGLAPGDRVAAAGAFLIDAESRLNPGNATEVEAPIHHH